ncbi:MAG: DNA polymerase III subunit alpha [Solirubrobacterales bacterium]
MGFVHLHTHSEYSLLDGAARVKGIVAKAARLGMPAAAITDHGVMHAALDFYKEAKKTGIRPVIGFEAYVARRSRMDRVPKVDDSQYHLILLAENEIGYRNLLQLCTRGFSEGFYYKPRIDRELLEQYHDGIIALSACLAGEIPDLIMAGREPDAETAARYYRDLFGPDRFFLELQDHGIPEQQAVNQGLLKIAGKTGIPLVATNDAHYLEREDAFIHDVLLCIQTGKTINDENRMRFSTPEFYFKSEAEMAELFPNHAEALSNTGYIAERCAVDLSFGGFHLPEFPVPAGQTAESYLRELVVAALPCKLPNYDDAVLKRAEYELDVIDKMGFAGYFLIVQDLVNWSRQNGVAVGPGRGSAAGSLVSYLLGITSINPLKYGLLFERFLNPERVSMPDIDLDFCFENRGRVIEYIINRYGHDRVAQIITFGTMAARAAIKDVGRALDLSYAETDRIAKLIPAEIGVTIDRSLQVVPELIEAYRNDNQVRRLMDTARALEGMPRHASVHAAGVVIGNRELAEILPLQRTSDDHTVTQFPKDTVEEIGLLKMDILGLRTLTVIHRSMEIIEKTRGVKIDIDQLPLDDPKVYEHLSRGDAIGVFQFESDGMRRLLTEIRPNRFEDLVAINALYRPGPLGSGMVEDFINRKHGRQDIAYPEPRLEPILDETYGVILYQEQVMQIAGDLADFTMGEADSLRRAMGKKKPQEIQKMRAKFVEGAGGKGIHEETAGYLFDLMESFAGYGFNKSHSAAYALVSYQTAYLKVYYPVEYMCAFLTSVIDNQDRVVFYLKECRRMGIEILPPDVNESHEAFTVTGSTIRFGLGAIKSVGETAINTIVRARKAEGPFASLFDFCCRADLRQINKRVLENLILAGCFDSLGLTRKEALSIMDECVEAAACIREAAESSQLSLFGEEERAPEEPKPRKLGEFPPAERMRLEKEVLGFYVSETPLSEYKERLHLYATHNAGELEQVRDGAEIRIAGLVTSLQRRRNKNGEPWAILTIEDFSGKSEVLFFPSAYRENAANLKPDNVVMIEGRLINRNEEVKVSGRTIAPIAESVDSVHIRVQGDNGGNDGVRDRMVEVLTRHPGTIPVYVHIKGSKTLRMNEKYWVTPDEPLRGELRNLVGGENVWFA